MCLPHLCSPSLSLSLHPLLPLPWQNKDLLLIASVQWSNSGQLSIDRMLSTSPWSWLSFCQLSQQRTLEHLPLYPRSNSGSHVAFHSGSFGALYAGAIPQFFFVSHGISILKNAGQCFLMMQMWDYCILGGNAKQWFFTEHYVSRYMMLVALLLVVVTLITWIRWCLPDSPFVINK